MIKMLENKYLTVIETAALAGCTESYVRWLIRQKQLQCEQVGKRTYLIPVEVARQFARKPRKTGRPRKFEKN